jgi:hypothetical protein
VKIHFLRGFAAFCSRKTSLWLSCGLWPCAGSFNQQERTGKASPFLKQRQQNPKTALGFALGLHGLKARLCFAFKP